MSVFRPRAARPTIRTRILAIAWVPSLVLLVVGIGVAGVFARQGVDERKLNDTYINGMQIVAKFVAAEQRERQLTVAYLLDRSQSRQPLDAQRLQVNVLLGQLAPLTKTMQEIGTDRFVEDITPSGASIEELPQFRKAVDSGSMTALEASKKYSETLEIFFVGIESLGTSAATPQIAAEYQLTANLFRAQEQRLESETFERAAFSSSGLTEEQYGVFVDRVGGYHSLLAMTLPRLPAAERAQLQELMTSTAWQQLQLVEDTALRSGGTARGTAALRRAGALPVSQGNWDASSAEVSRIMINQYLQHVTYSTRLAADHAHELLIRSVILGASLVVLALLVFAVVTRMSNRLIRRLRRLRGETLELVSQRLPAIVERLSRGEHVDVDSELPPLKHGNDEIGQVADAFNEAQRTAVAAAAKEAETRAGTSKVFLNIAHRSQIVAHRQLKLLDQAERTQEDPDQLSLLFQLDHLTTRARRNAENLIILGGGQAGRRWRNPVPLLDVVRSAVGEAETYTGISIGQMPKASVAGAAVADVIHLLAELVDNATSFSPPTARVEVRGNVAGRGIIIEIEDQGLGIEPDQLAQLNTMLQQPPDFSMMALSEEPRLGLFVVTQLAVRHGVRVSLTESPSYGGIRAVVLIPMELISSTLSTLPEVESGPVATRRELRETIPAKVEVIGSVLPTRKSSRMISLAPSAPVSPEPPAAEPPPAQPWLVEARHTEARPEPRPEPQPEPQREPWPEARPTEVRATDPWAARRPGVPQPPAPQPPAAESPAPLARGFIAPPGRTGPARPGESAPRTSEIPRIQSPAPGAAEPVHRNAGSDQAANGGPANGGRDQRPALPRRTKQAHLAPQLLRDGRTGVEPPPPPVEALPSAESARSRLAAFQRGTRQGRQSDPM